VAVRWSIDRPRGAQTKLSTSTDHGVAMEETVARRWEVLGTSGEIFKHIEIEL
jgi:hypothetical protein